MNSKTKATIIMTAVFTTVVTLLVSISGFGEEKKDTIPYWTEDSQAAASIMDYVESVCDRDADSYVAPEDRIVVFDFDGTLYGELYPVYFDTCLFLHRALHDETFQAPEDILEYAKEMEEAVYQHLPEPKSDRSTAQTCAECFKGMPYEEYRAYIRDFMTTPAYGFEGMTYSEGFYKPMTALVQYLKDHEFTIFISSGSERTEVRELIQDHLDEWIPADRVIGSTFSLEASGQGEENGRKYTYQADDEVILEGNLTVKNQKCNKVFSIINEIGKTPILVFGNSSGDLAMGQYTVQNGGKGYMLLCDDTERDYGDLEIAEKFAGECEEIGLETVSMKNDFATIYGDDVKKVREEPAVGTEAAEETEELTLAA